MAFREGSYWFSPREACARRDMKMEKGYAADVKPVPLDQLDEELCQLIHGKPAPQEMYSGYFGNITDLLYMSLYKGGGSYVEHRHWAVWIEPVLDNCIKKARDEGDYKEVRNLALIKFVIQDWALRRYRFYATG